MAFLFSRKKYKTLNRIEIDASALKNNYQQLQHTHPEAKICPVLKSNAYGHGLTTVAPIFDSFQPEFLIVDSLYEAYEIYKIGIQTPILILGYTHPDNFKIKKLPFHYTVFDLELAEVLNEYQTNAKIHLFVDTGMSREGIPLKRLSAFIKEIKKLKNLEIEGLASHFADADNPQDEAFSKLQLNNFKKALTILEAEGITPKWKHISASAGSFKYPNPTFTMIRAGLSSYGISPLESSDPFFQKVDLKPALNFYSTIAQIKTIEKGNCVGYNCTFIADKEMTIGLLPAGYYEGVDRRLSNKGFIKYKHVFCPILGRVSMNMTVIDISEVKNPKVGDEVCIYSSEAEDKNSLVNSAKMAGTIPYELLVHLAESVRREVK